MGRLNGRVALVTGGASGIGAAASRALSREGATVIITDVQDEKGHGLADEIRGAGGQARHFHQDVTSEEGWVQIIGEIRGLYSRLDVLVNNAGIGISCPSITQMSLGDFQRQQAINVDGVFLGLKHSLPLMREAGHGGSVINISSVAGLKGAPTLAAYSATKGAVRLLTKSVAVECARARDGVRVNSVHPGIIETPIWESIRAVGADGSNAPPDLDAMSALAVPMGVKGLPTDIADGIVWLASDESRYVTGAELVIDGGMTAV